MQIGRLGDYFLLPGHASSQANLLSPILYIITSLAILWLMNYERRKGMFCSGLLFSFWILVCLAMIPDVIDDSVAFRQRVNQNFHSGNVIFRVFLERPVSYLQSTGPSVAAFSLRPPLVHSPLPGREISV